mmetsp:Transcript_65342/g.173250  ORF Transcript_65342/g.173250 Transcript_65342/m.173250 type:complete len:85 (-) Transcript_65342:75-329(-)
MRVACRSRVSEGLATYLGDIVVTIQSSDRAWAEQRVSDPSRRSDFHWAEVGKVDFVSFFVSCWSEEIKIQAWHPCFLDIDSYSF